MITIYVRFEQVQAELKWRHRNKNLIGEKKLRFLNKLSLPIGLGISFGLCLLGSFQLHSQRTLAGTDGSRQLTKEEYIVQKIHWFGAFLTYMGGNIYMFIQTIISIVLSLGTKRTMEETYSIFKACHINTDRYAYCSWYRNGNILSY